MAEDETVMLIKEAMIGAGLDEDEAQRVATSAQGESLAIKRFECIEEDLTQLATAFKQLKRGAAALATLVLGRFVGDIYEWIQTIGAQ